MTGKLHRSQHAGKGGKFGATSIKRTSSQSWLSAYNFTTLELEYEPAQKMSQRIKLATRLHAAQEKGGEQFQVANYGIGGVYNHHTDSGSYVFGSALNEKDFLSRNFGERIATAMGYLSDVLAGGATVFPNLGITIWPKKGDFAFW